MSFLLCQTSIAQKTLKDQIQSLIKPGQTYKNGWIIKEVKGNDLLDVPDDSVYQYINLKGIVTFYQSNGQMAVRTMKEIFDVDDKSELIIVGFYDENHKLIKKEKLYLSFQKDYQIGTIYDGSYIMNHILKNKGFVKMATSLYPSGLFEMELQCLNNSKDANEEIKL